MWVVKRFFCEPLVWAGPYQWLVDPRCRPDCDARVAQPSATQSLAKDARVSEGVMMTHYVKEQDLQFRAGSNAMFQRLCLSMTPEVARAFGHEHSATAVLEQRLREAIGSRNWPLVGQIAKKLAHHQKCEKHWFPSAFQIRPAGLEPATLGSEV